MKTHHRGKRQGGRKVLDRDRMEEWRDEVLLWIRRYLDNERNGRDCGGFIFIVVREEERLQWPLLVRVGQWSALKFRGLANEQRSHSRQADRGKQITLTLTKRKAPADPGQDAQQTATH